MVLTDFEASGGDAGSTSDLAGLLHSGREAVFEIFDDMACQENELPRFPPSAVMWAAARDTRLVRDGADFPFYCSYPPPDSPF